MTRRAAAASAALLWLATFACGCDGEGLQQETTSGPFPADLPRPDFDTATIEVGGIPVTVEIADTGPRRAYGLMFVEHLADDRGMLFMYADARPVGFWMRNTRIPLDIAFLSPDGRILNVHRSMTPLSEWPNYPSAGSCRFALELPGGWFERHSLDETARVRLPPDLLARKASDDPSPDIPRRLKPE